jgi:hypothetical protein
MTMGIDLACLAHREAAMMSVDQARQKIDLRKIRDRACARRLRLAWNIGIDAWLVLIHSAMLMPQSRRHLRAHKDKREWRACLTEGLSACHESVMPLSYA